MKILKLTKDKSTWVDDEDFEWLNQWKWAFSSDGYAVRTQYLGGGRKNAKFKTICLHRLVLNAERKQQVDHINRNRLDNRKKNLRTATSAENAHNSKIRKANTSGYKGVAWHKASKKWIAQIGLNLRRIYLGVYSSPEKAAQAYNKAAKQYFGEFVNLNTLEEPKQ